ncbi:MAG: hypothetical protein DI625_07475 [Sphingomonas sp.]|nr:MAG: hypothetical protein DI625_07475 [Sphingomonas sp.]
MDHRQPSACERGGKQEGTCGRGKNVASDISEIGFGSCRVAVYAGEEIRRQALLTNDEPSVEKPSEESEHGVEADDAEKAGK